MSWYQDRKEEADSYKSYGLHSNLRQLEERVKYLKIELLTKTSSEIDSETYTSIKKALDLLVYVAHRYGFKVKL